METTTLNEALRFSFPDGFRKLSEAEMKQMKLLQSGPGVCLRDEDRHIIVSLGYRRAGLFDAILGGKDLVKSAQSRIAGVMRPYGYQLAASASCPVGNKTGQYFQYTYTAQNTEMVGECCAIKEGKTIYYLHFYVRKTSRDEGFALWREILQNARWL